MSKSLQEHCYATNHAFAPHLSESNLGVLGVGSSGGRTSAMDRPAKRRSGVPSAEPSLSQDHQQRGSCTLFMESVRASCARVTCEFREGLHDCRGQQAQEGDEEERRHWSKHDHGSQHRAYQRNTLPSSTSVPSRFAVRSCGAYRGGSHAG